MKPLDSRTQEKLNKHFQEACAYQQRGELDRAQHGYRRVLELDHHHVPSLNNLSWIYLQRQAWREAAALLQRALAKHPAQPDACCNLGLCHDKLGEPVKALACYTQAVQGRPDFAGAYYNRAALLHRLGRVQEAVSDYRQAIACQPTYADAHNNLGNALTALGHVDEAIACFQEAVRLKPAFAEAWNNRGVCYWRQRRYDEALQDFNRALALAPTYVEALANRLTTLFDAGDYTAAQVAADALLAVQSQNATGVALQWEIHARQCAWTGMDQHAAAVARAVEQGLAVRPFTVLAALDDPRLHAMAARQWAQALRQQGLVINETAPAVHPLLDERIRVAYLSGDFHEHAVAFALARVFELHGKTAFTWFALSCGQSQDNGMRQRIHNAFDHFVDVRQWPDQAVRDYLAENRIDILVDLGGYTGSGRPALVLSRAAPVQVNFLGYAGTLGDATVDYVLADQWVLSATAADTFSEKPVWLAGSIMPIDPTRAVPSPPSRAAQGLPENAFVFCCFNQPYKITPAWFAVWMRILQRVPGSVLWLASEDATVQANLHQQAEQHGVASARVLFARRESQQADHLARMALADLFLDTLPYNAHATASDALWAGLPLLTCTGHSFPARVSTGLLMALGMSEWVTDTAEAFEQQAVYLATQPAVLSALRERLQRLRSESRVFDAAAFARQLEWAYRAMHERRVQGLLPMAMHVPPVV